MINIEDCTEKCYAKVFGVCTVLRDTDCGGKETRLWQRIRTRDSSIRRSSST